MLLHDNHVVAGILLCVAALGRVDSRGAPRSAGILYEVWHCKAATAMAQVKAKGFEQLTTELVLRSSGSKTLDDVFPAAGEAYASADIWNVEPAGGQSFYCLCTKRAENDTLPQCPMAAAVARRHAAMLSAAGFDYVAVDITNWPQVNDATDVAVLRPLEVLFEQWLALRAEGLPTPQIAAWCNSPVLSYADGHQTTWRWLLEHVYNNITRAPLLWRRPDRASKAAFFVTDNSFNNDTVNAAIASNGGRDDIDVQKMWALFGEASYAAGSWGFFSPCTDNGRFTTSMVGVGGADCAQYTSADRAGGVGIAEVTASGGYMLSQCSLPLAAPGKMRGLVLQRTFKRVLELGAPNLFVSSFNEHIGGRQAPAYGSNVAFNMGLPGDPQRANVWVDTYGAEYSRDLEPSVEGGARVWEVASACVRLYKAGLTCASSAEAAASACCTTADKQVFASVWSLRNAAAGDALLTVSAAEKAALVAGGGGWSEVCNSIGGPTAFCVNGSIADGRDGPFIMYNTSSAVPNAIPLRRCITAAGLHFVSVEAACEGLGEQESVLGFMAPSRGGETLRALRRCGGGPNSPFSHALDLPCDDEASAVLLGYVR